MKKKITLAALALALAVGYQTASADCGGDHAKKESKAELSIYETAKSAGFSTLIAAVDAAGLKETLEKDGPLTVFAPTDEAFAALPEGALEALLKDKDALKNVLLYHVVPGSVMASDVTKLESAKMANGSTASINTKDGVKIAGVNVVKTDIVASNGVIHVIDAVMLPTDDQAAR